MVYEVKKLKINKMKPNIHSVLDKLLLSKAISSMPGNVEMLVFSNPDQNTLNIQINNIVFKQLSIEIINNRGKIVYSDKTGHVAGDYSKQIDVSSLAKGVYYLKVKETCLNLGNRNPFGREGFFSVSKVIIQ